MTYTTKMLKKIGRVVIKEHPDLANQIIERWPTPGNTDLTKIPEYFLRYCEIVEVEPARIKGPVYKSSITEVKKVFISAMINIYRDQYLLKKIISDTLEQRQQSTCTMVKEVEFRYLKEDAFKQKVDKILNQFL